VTDAVKRWGPLALVLVALMLFGAVQFGNWLVKPDSLARATSIVVLGGQVPFRAMEAARVYHQHWAPEVWLTQGGWYEEDEAMVRLGIDRVQEYEYSRQVLERLGVPANSIRVLAGHTQNTAAEVRTVAEALKLQNGYRVILVTSKMHSRRVKTIWRKLVGDHPEVIVRYTPDDPARPDRWWKNTGDAMAVSREFFGLLNAWAGFPIKSERW